MDCEQGGDDEEDYCADLPEVVGRIQIILGTLCGSTDPNGDGGDESDTDEMPV